MKRMKKTGMFLAVVVVLMMLVVNVLAQTAGQRVSAIERDISALETEKIGMRSEQVALNATKQRLDSIIKFHNENVRIFDQNVEQLEADFATYKSENDQLNAEIRQHNSWKPNPRDKGEVDSYNAEASQQNSRRANFSATYAKLQRRLDDQEFVNKSLTNSEKKIDDMETAWATKQENLNNRKIEFKAKLAALKRQYVDTCRELLENPKTKMEALRLKCGNVQFDGADPNLPTLEDLGIHTPYD